MLAALLAFAPRSADALILYALRGDDPSIGGEFRLDFQTPSFITAPPVAEPIPGLTECVVLGSACPFATIGISGSLAEFNTGHLTVHLPVSALAAVGTYVSLNLDNLVTMTVSETITIPEPASLALLAMPLSYLVLRRRRRCPAPS